MSPLGLGLGITGATEGDSSIAVVIEDYMWEVPTAGELTPLALGTVSDFHDTWDLDGTDYTLAAIGSISDEGYWGLDNNSDAQPLNV